MEREHSLALPCRTEDRKSRPIYRDSSHEQHHFRDNPTAAALPRRPRISMPRNKAAPTAWKRWELTHFSEAAGTVAARARSAMTHMPPTAVAPAPTLPDGEAARLSEAARREGYQAGFDSGREAAAADGRQLAARLAQAISRFDSGVAQLEQTAADEVLALALEVARKVIHQAIAVQPRIILDVIRDALLQMPLQHAMIHLNPEDAALVRTHGGEHLTHAGHRIQEDPQLVRGDVVIEAGGAHLNARLATRWQNVLATLDQDTPWLATDDTVPP
jgi:flagellar assembly protein FliH